MNYPEPEVSRLPDGYVAQNGCANCARVFCMTEWDTGDALYCTYKAGPRPKCGSVYMNEMWFDIGDNTAEFTAVLSKIENGGAKWRKWSEGRSVLENGLCPRWKQVKTDSGSNKLLGKE